MYSYLAIASMMLLIGGAYDKEASARHIQDRQRQQQTDSVSVTSGWRTYTNTKFGFRFRYPNHWKEANTVTDRANIVWINFITSSAGATRNVLYVKVFPDRRSFSMEEGLIAGNATATQVTVDRTTQKLYGDFLDLPTVMISNKSLLLEIGDPSHEGHLKQILATFKFTK